MSAPLATLPDAQLRAHVLRARKVRLALARESVDAFNMVVLRDVTTGRPFKQAPVHRQMNAVLDAYDRCVVWGFTESGKTSQLAGRILHLLGKDPTQRIAIVSATAGMAVKILTVVARLIEERPEVREVFPALRKGYPWRETAINLEGRAADDKDFSVVAFGIAGNALGARFDTIILDDVVTLKNSRTPKARDELYTWVFNTLMGRLTARGRVIVTGNAYHPEDFMHRAAKLPGWRGFKFPAIVDGASQWPERFSLERLERKRAEDATEFARTMMCQARSEEDAWFKRADVDAAAAAGVGRGLLRTRAQWERAAEARGIPRAHLNLVRCFTGVDLAVQTHAAADYTSLFTVALHPDNRREVVDVQIGRWPGDEILQRIRDTHAAWDSLVAIENVAGQDWIRQFAVKFGAVPVVPFTTGRGQANLDFQAQSLAAEITSGLWVIPSLAPNVYPRGVREWVEALLYYDPSAHTPDVMAASLFARWLAAKAALAGRPTPAAALGAAVGPVGLLPDSVAYDAGRAGCWG